MELSKLNFPHALRVGKAFSFYLKNTLFTMQFFHVPISNASILNIEFTNMLDKVYHTYPLRLIYESLCEKHSDTCMSKFRLKKSIRDILADMKMAEEKYQIDAVLDILIRKYCLKRKKDYKGYEIAGSYLLNSEVTWDFGETDRFTRNAHVMDTTKLQMYLIEKAQTMAGGGFSAIQLNPCAKKIYAMYLRFLHIKCDMVKEHGKFDFSWCEGCEQVLIRNPKTHDSHGRRVQSEPPFIIFDLQ